MQTSGPTDVEQMGEFVASGLAQHLEASLLERIKLLVLDTLGCAALAAHLTPTERLLATFAATESAGPASVWLHHERLSAANAALVNCTEVHGFELDDITSSLGHYGCVTVPVALALAESGAQLSGAELISSVVAGIEIGLRVNECTGAVPHLVSGFHGPSLFGTFAAAATASAVLRLNPSQCVDALAHAAQFAGGIMGAQHGGMGKRLLPGRAAQAGVFAAQLAANGFTNTARIFDCGYGSFPSAFSGGREDYDLSQLSADLGVRYRSHEVSFKMWACRIPIHPALEAIKELRAMETFSAAEVEQLTVRLPEGSYKSVGNPYVPDTVASAQLNLQYCVAAMLLEGDVFQDQFTDEKIHDPEILALAARVRPEHGPELDDPRSSSIAQESDVEVVLHDGRRFHQRGTLRGAAGVPITRDDVVAKFRRLCARNLPGEVQENMIRACLELDELRDATQLSEMLRPSWPHFPMGLAAQLSR
jgi:aconitate decarboxylase